jgi:hypothetical protein
MLELFKFNLGSFKFSLLAGIPFLLIISLCSLYWNLVEQKHRAAVLANGKDARASLQRILHVESAIVDWRDFAGAPRTGQAYTGKSFARLLRDRQDIAIKYDANFVLEPVILSQVAERDRVNRFWIMSDLWVAFTMMLVCVMFGVFKFRGARPPRVADQ